MWFTPKTNWKETDYYNIDDWDRVCSNLEYLHSCLIDLEISIPSLLETNTGRGFNELPYVHLINNMEENLNNLLNSLNIEITENIQRKIWYDRMDIMYESNPNYQDWNRWENILLLAYKEIQTNYTS